MKKYLLTLLLCLIILAAGSWYVYGNSYYHTWREVKNLQSVSSNAQPFALSFDAKNYSPSSDALPCHGFEGCEISSPLFPNRDLVVQTLKEPPQNLLTNEHAEQRWLYTDTYWKVFWVGIMPANESKQIIYGPFKTN